MEKPRIHGPVGTETESKWFELWLFRNLNSNLSENKTENLPKNNYNCKVHAVRLASTKRKVNIKVLVRVSVIRTGSSQPPTWLWSERACKWRLDDCLATICNYHSAHWLCGHSTMAFGKSISLTLAWSSAIAQIKLVYEEELRGRAEFLCSNSATLARLHTQVLIKCTGND